MPSLIMLIGSNSETVQDTDICHTLRTGWLWLWTNLLSGLLCFYGKSCRYIIRLIFLILLWVNNCLISEVHFCTILVPNSLRKDLCLYINIDWNGWTHILSYLCIQLCSQATAQHFRAELLKAGILFPLFIFKSDPYILNFLSFHCSGLEYVGLFPSISKIPHYWGTLWIPSSGS